MVSKGEKLSKKEKGFIKDYLETGNATEASVRNYNVKSRIVAKAMGTQILIKPKIQKSLAELLPDELLAEKHMQLFEQKELAYFVFPKNGDDEEIKEHLKANGLDLIVIRPTDKGKLAFYSIPDSQAVAKALDMGYKIKGTYAAEKVINLNANIDTRDPKAIELAKKYEEELKKDL